MKEPKYKWSNPHDWLSHAVWEGKILHGELMALINECIDADDIQDRFQDEMDKDGYFEAEDE